LDKLTVVDAFLKGKKWLVGSGVTLADLLLGNALTTSFQIVLDDSVRKSLSNLTAWFKAYVSLPEVVKSAGHIKMCSAALLPLGVKAGDLKVADAAGDDDDLDLFGDDDEEDIAAAKKAADEAKAKALKPKKVVIAQSLVMFAVKPLDDTTDLDELAKEILAITMDGLYWKTEYRKDPVAFGIFKLIIAVTVEDDKVSVDDLQEKIEAIEDKVQSVDILAFNKI
jgi:translation elongation factor EF-1beta